MPFGIISFPVPYEYFCSTGRKTSACFFHYIVVLMKSQSNYSCFFRIYNVFYKCLKFTLNICKIIVENLKFCDIIELIFGFSPFVEPFGGNYEKSIFCFSCICYDV